MAKVFCLLPNKIEKFKKALKEKDIKISDLLNMTSAERIKLLEKYAGKNAKDVNLLFEKKLVLKNKAIGIQNWASKIGEIGRYDPAKKAELKRMQDQYKKIQEERIFNPKEEQTFLNDLADQALGTHVTRLEAKNIFEMSRKSDVLKEKFNEETGEWSSPEAKLEYGASKVMAENYIDGLIKNKTLKDMILERYYEGKSTFKENKAKAVTDLVKDTLSTISDNAVAFVASIDNSFLGRQGLNTLLTEPKIWKDMASKSFSDIYKSLKSKHGNQMAKDIVMADVYSRPNYIKGNYEIAKLIPRAEEQFPTTLPEKLPVIGRAFSASEAAFTNSAIRARINTFDKLIELAESQGKELNKEFVQDVGRLVNSATARGSLGKAGEGGVIKLLLWAPKMLKANWDVLTAHTGGAGLKTAFARKRARVNLIKIASATSGIMAMLNALDPGSVELDPRSTDFLRYKKGNTRFDLTGGKGSIITLIARALTMSTKSSTTGIVTELNKGGFADRTLFDIGIDFLKNKTAPFVRAGLTVAEGRTFEGDKPTVGTFTKSLVTPISVQNFIKTYYGETDPQTEEVIADILDLIGVSGGTYSTRDNWEVKDTKELNQFRDDVGDKQFKKANIEYNKIINKEITALIKTDSYKNLTDDEKRKKITKIKKDAKNKIFKEYNP